MLSENAYLTVHIAIREFIPKCINTNREENVQINHSEMALITKTNDTNSRCSEFLFKFVLIIYLRFSWCWRGINNFPWDFSEIQEQSKNQTEKVVFFRYISNTKKNPEQFRISRTGGHHVWKSYLLAPKTRKKPKKEGLREITHHRHHKLGKSGWILVIFHAKRSLQENQRCWTDSNSLEKMGLRVFITEIW